MVPKSSNNPATVEVVHPKTKKGHDGNGSALDNEPSTGGGDGGTTMKSIKLRYIPTPHEQSYYESLYRVASQVKTPICPPSIPFSVASQFFSLSRLPIARLRIIWKMADPDDSQTLTKHQFNVAVRLVQLHQNGQRVKDMELNPQQEKVILKPAFFEGVSATKVPLPRKGALKREGSEQTNVSELTFGSFDSPPQLRGGNGRGGGDAGGGKKKDTVAVGPGNVAAQRSHASMGRARSQQKPRTTTTRNKTAARVANGAPRLSTASTSVGASAAAASAQHPLCPYTMTAAEIKAYSAAFAQHREVNDNHGKPMGTTPKVNGHVYVPAAVKLFAQSGLDHKRVGSIWNLVLENPAEDRLNKIEFVMMMHIVECATKKGLVVPTTLPESLMRWRDGVKRAKESTAVPSAEKVTEEPVVVAGQQCPYSMTSEEAESYGETFKRRRVTTKSKGPSGEIPRDEGHIYVPSAVEIFTKAGLDQKQIGSLWDLIVENPNAGRLERMEFILMMHLAVCVAQRGLALPESLPFSLQPWKGGSVLSEMDAVTSAAGGPLSSEGKVDEPSKVGGPCCKSCTSLSKRCADLGMEVWSMRNELEESQTTVRQLRKEIVAMQKDIARNNDVTESATRQLEELEQKMERMRSRPARQLSSKSLHKQLSSRSIRASEPIDGSAILVVNGQKRAALHGSQSMSRGGGKDRSSRSLTKHESDRSMDINEAVLRKSAAAFGDDDPSDRRRTSGSEQGHSSWHSSSEWAERNPFKIVKKRRSKQQKWNSSSDDRSRYRKGDNKSATSKRWGRQTGESDKEQSYDSSSSLEPEILELRKVKGTLSHSGHGFIGPEAIMSEEEELSGDEVVMHPAYQRRGSLPFAASKRKVLNVLGSTNRDEVFVPQNWASNEERRSTGPKKGGMMSLFGFSMRGDTKS